MNERATDEAPLVATVVLNWRRREGTLSCLGALVRLEYPRNIAILVDNGCEDFSAAEIAALLPTARYLRTPVNLGFAGGAILYDTSNVLHHYNTNQHVAASLALFAAIALLFYYIVYFLIQLQSGD